MKDASARAALWIHSAAVDSIFFSFGWILVFAAFVLTERLGFKNPAWPLLLAFVLAVSFIHRHLTFPLVYADPEQFARRRRAYYVLPIFFLILTAAAIFYVQPGARPARPLMVALVFLSIVWNIYHTIMQKMGILRIYSRKAGYGKPWLDKAILFIWFGAIFFLLAASPQVHRLAARLSSAGKILNKIFQPWMPVLPYVAAAALAVALVTTVLYAWVEWKHREHFHWPKNVFVVSVLALYGTMAYDFLAGYAAFGFSHALEYIVFVNVFSKRKFLVRPVESSLLARAVRRQALSFLLFAGALLAVFFAWRNHSRTTLEWYIIGSSFLHFLYDGWIWKVRQPEVGKPLGLVYEPPSAQPA